MNYEDEMRSCISLQNAALDFGLTPVPRIMTQRKPTREVMSENDPEFNRELEGGHQNLVGNQRQIQEFGLCSRPFQSGYANLECPGFWDTPH
jgi:hypothetical protein